MHHSSENLAIFIRVQNLLEEPCFKTKTHTKYNVSLRKNDKTGQSETSQRNSRIQEMNYS